MSISNDDAAEIIERLKLASFAEIGPNGKPNGKSLIRLEDAILVTSDQTEMSDPLKCLPGDYFPGDCAICDKRRMERSDSRLADLAFKMPDPPLPFRPTRYFLADGEI